MTVSRSSTNLRVHKLMRNTSLWTVAAFLLGFTSVIYLTARQQRANANQLQVAFVQSSDASEKGKWTPGKAITYDFSKMPDGRLSTDDWTIEKSTEFDHNGESQEYTDSLENVRIEDGTLVIQAMPSNKSARGFTSARIHTKDKFHFMHGTLEIDMKLPRGTGSWPAAWLMPQHEAFDIHKYGIKSDDPQSWLLNGEIDFMESIGALPGKIIPAAHSYNSYRRGPLYTPAYVSDAYEQYHRYGVVKKPNSIIFTVDGIPYASRERTGDSAKDWPFEQSYYLILNLAVGGKWAGEKGIDESSMPWKLNIRSVSYKPL